VTKLTVADQMLKFGGGHIFLGGDKYPTDPDIRRRLGRLGTIEVDETATSITTASWPVHTHLITVYAVA